MHCVCCLEQYERNEIVVNVACGHSCVCTNCHSILLESRQEENTMLKCPVCRTPGDYIVNISNIVSESDDEDDNVDEHCPRFVKQLLNDELSSEYNVHTAQEGTTVAFDVRNIDAKNFSGAYYGTECDVYNGDNPYFIDISERVRNALLIKRPSLMVNDGLVANKLQNKRKEKNWLLVVIFYREI